MPRRLLHVALILLLLFAQLQALVHPLQHIAQHTAAQAAVNSTHVQDAQHEETCGQCIVLAGLGSAVQSRPPAITPLFILQTPALESFVTCPQRFTAQYQSRAPPPLLIV